MDTSAKLSQKICFAKLLLVFLMCSSKRKSTKSKMEDDFLLNEKNMPKYQFFYALTR